jgi:hypothetical protein
MAKEDVAGLLARLRDRGPRTAVGGQDAAALVTTKALRRAEQDERRLEAYFAQLRAAFPEPPRDWREMAKPP